jgi:cysteinyl-tRNA synthetase
VEGEKMSKSLGNFLTIHDLLKQFPGEALRLNMLSTHYRQPFNWTEAGVKNAFATLDTWYKLTAEIPEPSKAFISPAVLDCLKDDMNTPRAITEMHDQTVNWTSSNVFPSGQPLVSMPRMSRPHV